MKRRGITLLETIVSTQILFIVSLFCMAMFGQGQRHDLRARQFSTCAFLANRTMQELTCLPGGELSKRLTDEETAAYTGEFADYSYVAKLSDYEPGLGHLEVVARSKLGCSSRCSLLVSRDTEGGGLTLDPYTNRVLMAPSGSSLKGWDDSTGSALTAPPAHPEGISLGALAGAPGSGYLWTLGPLGSLRGLKEGAPWSWESTAFDNPTTADSLPPRWHSLACDRYTGMVVASDQANRCLWFYHADSGWKAEPCRPRSNPLGMPGAVAMDPYGSLVWVADREHNCVRKFLVGSLPAGYSAAAYERWPAQGDIQGYWDVRSYRPKDDFLGTPQGLAMDENGYSLFVLDGGGIWNFRESESSSPWTREARLSGYRSLGLATDRFGTLFYLSGADGKLLKVVPKADPGDPTITTLIP